MKKERGLTFIDVLVGTAIVLIVFLGIFGAFQLGLKVISQSQNKISATAIANQWIEKMRNLPYGSIGTTEAVLPFAEGTLDSATTTVLNNLEYSIEIGVKYISDPADGTGLADTCDLDYKRAEVKVSWSGRFTGQVKLVTDISPKDKFEELASCEAQPGGILSIFVFDASGLMVFLPLIEIFDSETEILIDSYSPSSGKHDFPLATSSYKIMISKVGYSADGSYGIDEIATPEKPHPLVLEGKITEISFSIDKVSTFSVGTLSPWSEDFFSDPFEDQSKISESLNLLIMGGEINLATDTQGYISSGYLYSLNISPAQLVTWDEFSFSDSEPAETDFKTQLYYASGTEWYLIPDVDLSGNEIGLDLSPVDLSGLDPLLYSQIKIRGNFSTNATSVSPTLYDWQASWITSEATPISYLTFLLQGEKIIGTDELEKPVYKYSASSTSDSLGRIDVPNLEWDLYTFSVSPGSNLDLKETDPSSQPINLSPDTVLPVSLYFEAENSLFLTIEDGETLEPIFSASTTLSNESLDYEKNQFTDEKGQTYFIPLETANYSLEIEAPGYLSASTSLWVSGDVTKTIKLEKIE